MSDTQTLSEVIKEQNASLTFLAVQNQMAERRIWSMFILGLIGGTLIGYNV